MDGFFVWAPLPFKTGRVHQLEGNANKKSGQTPSAKNSRNPRKEATEESATDNTQSLARQFTSSLYTTRFGHQNQHSTLWLWLLSRVIRISSFATDVLAFAARYVIARCPAYPPLVYCVFFLAICCRSPAFSFPLRFLVD